jgi:predicted NUDIX family NTP pyrophosphohydrolase
MAARSAGLLLHRFREGSIELLVVHPGGPFWLKRDEGAWSIPKGEIGGGEEPLAVALREFEEELGMRPPVAGYTPLGSVRQAGGKLVHAWTAPGELDVTKVRSNTFDLEWPPRSGKIVSFPEVDRAAWFDLVSARRQLLAGQRPFVDRVMAVLSQGPQPN